MHIHLLFKMLPKCYFEMEVPINGTLTLDEFKYCKSQVVYSTNGLLNTVYWTINYKPQSTSH